MSKRLACPRCGDQAVHDVPVNEAMAPQREVGCRTCGHRFPYGFAAEYVTEREPEIREPSAPDDSYDGAAQALIARERLTRYVIQHVEYHDRDRDVLLLHLLEMADHLDHELSAVKRTLDVFVKRGR
jgi:hypothetical protein